MAWVSLPSDPGPELIPLVDPESTGGSNLIGQTIRGFLASYWLGLDRLWSRLVGSGQSQLIIDQVLYRAFVSNCVGQLRYFLGSSTFITNFPEVVLNI